MKSMLGAGRNNRGFSLIELVVVVAVLGILASMALPQLISYLTVATSTAGLQEMRVALGRAKQLAITSRQNICVTVTAGSPPTYQFRQGNCGGPAWRRASSSTVKGHTIPTRLPTATNPMAPRWIVRNQKFLIHRHLRAAPIQIAANPPTLKTTTRA